MSIIVDHEARRSMIADVAAGLIVEQGLQALTIRAIAGRAGYSTTVVTHYFADKRALLQRIYRDAALRAQARVDAVRSADRCDLAGCLEAFLPIDDASLRDWKLYFVFWDMSVSDAELAGEQRAWMQNARDIIAGVLAARAAAGATRHADPAEAQRLLTLVQGISVQAVFEESFWSPASQRAFLASELAR